MTLNVLTRPAMTSSPMPAAQQNNRRISLEQLDIHPLDGDGEFSRLNEAVSYATDAFDSLQSLLTERRQMSIETPNGTLTFVKGHTETVAFKHDPCPWCVKFRPQDLTPHEHMGVIADNPDLPIYGQEHVPDVIITTPFGTVYAWDDVVATNRGSDAVKLAKWIQEMSHGSDRDFVAVQLDAQMKALSELAPRTSFGELRVLYETISERGADIDLLREFVRRFETDLSISGSEQAYDLQIRSWCENIPFDEISKNGPNDYLRNI